MSFMFFVLIALLSLALSWLGLKNLTYNHKIGELEAHLEHLAAENFQLELGRIEVEEKLELERERNNLVVSQKKSSETRLGQTTEHLVPFLEGFPYEPKNCTFIGKPIDYLVINFDQGEIIFVEVKTGNAKESNRQRTIKNIIKSGRVFYETVRINQKGMTTKKAENLE